MNQPYSKLALGSPLIKVPSTALPFMVATMVALLSTTFGIYWLSALGIGAFVYYLTRLLQEAGVDLPIESFILVIASSQWIIGPVLSYSGLSDHWKYYMYVPQEEYMRLVVPAVILYSIGLYSFRSNRRIALITHYSSITRQIVNRAGFLPLYLIGIGIVFSFLVDLLPAALAFPGYVLSNLKYIGLIYLIFSDRQKNKTGILILAFLLTFFSSLRSSMFHDLLLWSAFIGMYAAYIFRPSLARKVGVVFMLLFLAFVIQSVKEDYRQMLAPQGETQQVSKFIQSVENRFADEEELRAGNIEKMVVRLNQGWIISRIMQQVPAVVPHANGETVTVALKASVLPRALFPEKPEAGGRANYMKYTGYYLQIGTSMSISLVGEAYINYGVQGAWLFMFIFGLISSFVIQKIFKVARNYPTIWLWFPLILFHFVKAETELLVQLNFLVKSIVMVYLFVWANKHFLRLKF